MQGLMPEKIRPTDTTLCCNAFAEKVRWGTFEQDEGKWFCCDDAVKMFELHFCPFCASKLHESAQRKLMARQAFPLVT